MTARTLPASLRAGLGLILALGIVGCASFVKHKDRHVPQYGIIDPNLPRELHKTTMPRHVVEPPDELQVSVQPTSFGLDQTRLVVQADGTIDLDFYGDLYVAGLTLDEVEAKLVARFTAEAERRKIREPVRASVRLSDGRNSKRFYVLGTVDNPRSFPITGNETVMDGILQAGLRSNSLPEKAYLVRPHPVDGAEQVYKIDWFGITQRGDTLTNYQLMPGDRIYVPGGRPPGLLQTLLGGG
jgi:polysaccharide export outer membrane protein